MTHLKSMSYHCHLYLLDLTAGYRQSKKDSSSDAFKPLLLLLFHFSQPHIFYFPSQSGLRPQVFVAVCQNPWHSENIAYPKHHLTEVLTCPTQAHIPVASAQLWPKDGAQKNLGTNFLIFEPQPAQECLLKSCNKRLHRSQISCCK